MREVILHPGGVRDARGIASQYSAVSEALAERFQRELDVCSHEDMESRLRLLEGIAKGEKAIREDRTVTHEQARIRMSRWLD